jgi:predicted transcriptional regulator
MSQPTTPVTVRLPAEIKDRLDRLAKATARSRSWLALDAVRTYLELQEWQIQEIEAGICEADSGDLASEAEVEAVRAKWSRRAR